MKKVSLILSAVLITTMTASFNGGVGSEESSGINNSPTFKEVKIGNQVWMVENLNVDKFRNGDPIPHAKTREEWEKAGKNKQPAWCYYDNDPANGEKYGKLYNWYVVNDPRGLAPKGWKIPSDEDWKRLRDFSGSFFDAGKKMKSTSGWKEDGNGTNESGFSGLPGGIRLNDGTFEYVGNYGFWWGSTEHDTYVAWRIYLFYNSDYAVRGGANKGDGFSVRCLRD